MTLAICLSLIMSTDVLHLPDSTYSAKGSESDSNMALSECIYCLPGCSLIFGGLSIN